METINKISKFISTPIGITILVVVFLILIALLLILIIKKPKEKNIEKEDKPNLMIPDPITDGNVNLMASDPLGSITETEPPIIDEEEPSLEKELSTLEEKINIKPNQEQTKKETPNAFEMTLEEKLEILSEETNHSHKTQKFCPECGTPNDVLNKFCISCGYNFEK